MPPNSHASTNPRASHLVAGTRGLLLPIVAYTTISIATSLLVACTDVTDVTEPDAVQPSALNSAAGALAYRAGTLGLFSANFSSAALYGGLLADEFTATNPGDVIDQRTLPDPNPGNSYPYSGLSAARVNGLIAIAALQKYAPSPSWRIAEMYALNGIDEVLFAENMCAGVPLATLQGSTPVRGQAMNRTQLLEQARIDFDSAARYSAGDDSIRNLASIGQGRALLDLDSGAVAAAITSSVPTSFVYQAIFSTSINHANQLTQALAFQIYAVSDREGINGLNFGTAADPRVPIMSLGTGSDGVTPLYVPIDTSQSTPMVVAGGIEARLIEAEARLDIGDVNGWLNILNSLRTNNSYTVQADSTNPSQADTTWQSGSGGVTGLRPLSDPGTPSTRLLLQYRERAFWLFGTAHRLGDLRRLARHYGFQIDSLFPTGVYKDGGSYGSSVVIPVTGESTTNAAGCSSLSP